ncbi:hypothetical protein C2E25_15100 [Geothermobacter hydrogeniphilus]|uniref:Helix-turn-helix domain-containing protein n=1 Tax=Geothermobacter hydrogeniphilus TaxID=1969733 RepID=A0A2K2H6S9_9BACT|nr:hypothetical protein [Geothermobacter hydrogeniphilus]PNU18951.1 hypothetical protein C2E25_15100 [Geothermobacter hydrogeniphilus]
MTTCIDRMPLAEVAQVLETTELNVLMHIKRGLLDGREEEGGWSVSRESLLIFMARNDGHRKVDLCRSACSQAGGCGGSCS